MAEHRTTGFGVVGEGLFAIGMFLPPPFNYIALTAGVVSRSVAWYMAKDRTLGTNPYEEQMKK